MTPATLAFATEVDAALDRLDVATLEREYWTQDEFLVIPRFLPAAEPGSMGIFNGDKVYHGVSPSREGERRVVYTMEYVTSQEMGRVQRLYSNLKDAIAYFGIRAHLRGRGRARALQARARSGS
jgi:hypothetical protein